MPETVSLDPNCVGQMWVSKSLEVGTAELLWSDQGGNYRESFPTGMIMRRSHDSSEIYQVGMKPCILFVQVESLNRPGLASMGSDWDIRRSDNPSGCIKFEPGRNFTESHAFTK